MLRGRSTDRVAPVAAEVACRAPVRDPRESGGLESRNCTDVALLASGVAGANITTIVRIERDESTGETIFEAHTPADLGEDLMVSEYGNHGVRGLFPIGDSVTW